MNRGLSFAIAALQALIIIATVVGLIIAPLTLAWFIEGNGQVEWILALRVAVYAFLLACGVPIGFAEGEFLGISFGGFFLTALPLGLTGLIVLMAIRIGHRLSAAASLWPAWLGGSLAFGGISYGASLLVADDSVIAGTWEPLYYPAIFFGLILIASSVSGRRFELFDGANGPEAKERIWIRGLFTTAYAKLHWSIRTALNPGVRVGLSVVAVLIFSSSTLIALGLGFRLDSSNRALPGAGLEYFGRGHGDHRPAGNLAKPDCLRGLLDFWCRVCDWHWFLCFSFCIRARSASGAAGVRGAYQPEALSAGLFLC